jgi:hypothetical protein
MSSPLANGSGHESRDVRFAPVLVGVAAVVALVLVSVAGMMGLFDALVARAVRQSPPANPLAAAAPRVPPEPRLQTLPILDLQALHAAEEKRLHGYAWADRDRGLARIPIERAMELLAARRAAEAGR